MPEPLLETDTGLLVSHGCTVKGPYLVVDRMNCRPWRRETLTITGRTLTLEATTAGDCAPRYCTGRHDLRTSRSQPCPDQARIANDADSQCRPCFRATGFNPAFYFANQISPQQHARNQQPHSVYLAWFGPGVLKVGMTHAPRGLSRLLEQGARFGCMLRTFNNADDARALEQLIASSFAVRETVRAARKRQLLTTPLSMSLARQQLVEMIESVAELRPDVDRHAEIHHLDSYYGDHRLLARAPTDLGASRPLGISGECLGMVGDVLITEQGGQRFMLSLGPLIGLTVHTRAIERPNRVTGQLGFSF